ncbi:MAG TPA: DUF4124 domain-containing protein [Burkholderiales bacterium]
MRDVLKNTIPLAIGAAMAVPAAALADLYRWRDPETGSTRFSNVAPPWHGDGARTRGPAVEVIPRPKPNPLAAAPATANGTSGPAKAAAAPRALPEFEGLRKAVLERLASVPYQATAEAGLREMQAAMAAYRNLVGQMDRADPEGAQARHVLDQPVLQKISEAFARRFGAAGGTAVSVAPAAATAPASSSAAPATAAPATPAAAATRPR